MINLPTKHLEEKKLHSFPSQTPKNTMTQNILHCKINLHLFQTFWNIFHPVHPITANLFKPFQKPLLKDPLHQNFFGVSPGTAHHSWCTAPPLEQDLPRLRHLTAPHPGWVQLLFDLQQFLDSLEMFGDVGKIEGYYKRIHPQFCVDFEVIPPSRWSFRHRLCCGTALQLRSWGRAYPPQWYHSLGAPSTDQTKPIEANNSNDRSVKCQDFSRKQIWIRTYLSLSVKLAPKTFHRKLPLKIKPHAQLPPALCTAMAHLIGLQPSNV